MNRKKRNVVTYTAALVIGCLAIQATAQSPLGSGFTYQGKLDLDGSPLDATADFEFTLWDADTAGNMIGSMVPVNNVVVVDGLFTVEIDFGVIAFNGDERWLEIAVRSPAGGGGFTTLDPRQPLTAAPYALQTRGLFVDDFGKVGIGTATPAQKLSLFDGELVLQVANNANDQSILFQNAGSAYTWRLYRSEAGAIDADFHIAGGPANVNFTALPDRLTIDAAGNVGIGTTTPATELDVAGTATATAFVGDGSGLTGIDVDDADADPANELQTLAEVLGQGNAAGRADMLDLGTVNADAFSSNLGALELQTDGTTRIYADLTTGKVGISNSNPNARLQVTGCSNFEGTLLLNYGGPAAPFSYPPALKIDGGGYNSVGGAVTGIEVDLSGATALDKYAAVFNGGNVGIGTDTPDEALHVSGGNILADRGSATTGVSRSLVLGGARQLQSSPYATIQFQNFDNDGVLGVDYIGAEIRSVNSGNTDAGDLRFFVNDGSGGGPSEGMRIDRDGNVGIGTTTPGEKLDVRGEIRYSTDAGGPYYPAAYDRNTVLVAGKVLENGGLDAGATSSRAIFSAVRDSRGDYTITFVQNTFVTAPIVTLTEYHIQGRNKYGTLTEVTSTGFHVKIKNIFGNDKDTEFNFIAIGER